MLLCIIQRRSERLALFVWSVLKNNIKYHPTPIGATCFFRSLYINQLPVVDRTQNVIMYHPTPIRATRAVCVECTQIFLLSIIQRQSDPLAFSFVIYQSSACSGSYPKCYYVSSNADRSDLRFSCGVYPNFSLSIIQRRLERLAFFVCYILINCL
jgi:hypothetical protein